MEMEKLNEFVKEIQPSFLGCEFNTSNMTKEGRHNGAYPTRQDHRFAKLLPVASSVSNCRFYGANFINSCLEAIAKRFKLYIEETIGFWNEKAIERDEYFINYVPNCVAKAWVRCPIEDLEREEGLTQRAFAENLSEQ